MAVTARLESMEVGLRKVTEALSKLTAEQSKKQEQEFTSSFNSGNTSQSHLKVPSAPPASPVSWAAAAAASVGAGGRGQGQGENLGTGRPRLGSIGNPQKRARQEEASQLSQLHEQQGHHQQPRQQQEHTQEQFEQQFQQFLSRNQLRRQRKVNYGCSHVNIEEEGHAAPLEYYIGNTTPRATKEIIESVLVKCAKGVDATTQFSVVEVQQLAVHIENPRTKCWKVVVPYKYKEMMEKDELYPPGWTHRKFFGPRKATQNNNKFCGYLSHISSGVEF